jgi:murein DD-endopeptidase MepM/ murein hydrolase activator NlpD
MKPVLLVTLLMFQLLSFSQTNSISVKDLKPTNGDESAFSYSLPYEKGKSYLLVQAYQSKLLSHKGEFALDFKMKEGTNICAARGGVVVEVKQDSKKGGIRTKYLSQGNHVIIKHDDGTYANYWHLEHNGALVHVGDTVQQGQVIALAGSTGYAMFSHLHFEVTTEPRPGHHHQLRTKFITINGQRYLKPLHRYTSI